MKVYENIIIGNFLFALGWAIRDKKTAGPLGCAINLLQQTPADKLLGDLLVGFEGVVRLIEFKREGARMSKEMGRHSLLAKSVVGTNMEAISREVHWYIETAATDDALKTRIVPYLDAFPSITKDQQLEDFIENLASQAVSQHATHTKEQIREYLSWVRLTQGDGAVGSGGLLLVVEPNGTLRYAPMRDLMDLNLEHQMWLAQEHHLAQQEHDLKLSKSLDHSPSKGLEYGR